MRALAIFGGVGLKQDRNVSFISLGCPKALVDSEHIVTQLLDDGYDVVGGDDPASVVVINTCGFIDAAKQESFEAIDQALDAGKEVVVTGCMGAQEAELRDRFPQLKYISGPAQTAPVMDAVRMHIPGEPAPAALPGEARVRLTPDHFGYLKISEGCNHDCSFCIIPSMRGPLMSRPIDEVVAEAHQMAEQGVKEALVIAQDLSAYGVDLKYRARPVDGVETATRLYELCQVIGGILPWVRLHYVYPYPSVDRLIPLMNEGLILPYLDVPLQHASPRILKSMRRPAAAEKTLARIQRWRELCPDLCIRSTFIVGFPGETDEDVGVLLDFLEQARLDRVGCFTYSDVAGARANDLPGQVEESDKLDRQERVYEVQAGISAQRLARLVGRRMRVLVDEAGAEPVARTQFDAPEIDGVVHLQPNAQLRQGEFAWVEIEGHDDHDLYAHLVGTGVQIG